MTYSSARAYEQYSSCCLQGLFVGRVPILAGLFISQPQGVLLPNCGELKTVNISITRARLRDFIASLQYLDCRTGCIAAAMGDSSCSDTCVSCRETCNLGLKLMSCPSLNAVWEMSGTWWI